MNNIIDNIILVYNNKSYILKEDIEELKWTTHVGRDVVFIYDYKMIRGKVVSIYKNIFLLDNNEFYSWVDYYIGILKLYEQFKNIDKNVNMISEDFNCLNDIIKKSTSCFNELSNFNDIFIKKFKKSLKKV